MKRPGQRPGAPLGYACIAAPGRYPASQLGTGLQVKGLWNCLGSLLEKYSLSYLVFLDKKDKRVKKPSWALGFEK